MKILLSTFLVTLCCLSLRAQTNSVNRTLLLATNNSITYFPKDAGILIKIPGYKSQPKFCEKMISFNETQKWEVKKLLDRYFAFCTALRETDAKFFSKSLGNIRQPHDGWKWAVGMEATIYISQEGKPLLILESKDALTEISSVLVLDSNEVHNVIELIQMIPDMEKESAGDPLK